MNNFRKNVLAGLVLIGAACSASAQVPDDIVPAPPGAASEPENQPQSEADRRKRLEEQMLSSRSFSAAATEQCFTSGSPVGGANDPFGLTFLKVCITNRGNISHFESPAGKVHLRAREGYVVCSNAGQLVHGFDAGSAEGGWGEPAVSQPNGAGKLPLVITRDSLDRMVRFTQTFTIIPGDREVQIVMAVKNISPSPLAFAILTRYFDGDIEGTTALDRYDRTDGSVWGASVPPPPFFSELTNGLMLTQAPSSLRSASQVHKFADWNPNGLSIQHARRCGGPTEVTPSSLDVDSIGRLLTSLESINPGQTKTVTYRYRRF